ncbi:MAG TPA: FtsX-like permease family protein [Mycobacteriales bacterium]|nr:FtsX-like permease family protein [Mycobacteriales bacterium]
MYPNLLAPLLGALALIAIGLTVTLIRQPVSRRLARRQVARRKTEAALVIIGSVLGTAIIIGALVVGDTLNHSVRLTAYRTLGPIDERVTSTDAATGTDAAARLRTLVRNGNPDVDGVLTATVDQAAAVATTAVGRVAEPRVLAWDVDFAAAAEFGQAGGSSGISGPNPSPGTVIINQPLATSLHVQAGNRITLLLYGRAQTLRIDRVLPEQGLAGAGLGANTNRNVFLAPGTLTDLSNGSARVVTFISNRGGVESGNVLTSRVTADINAVLGPTAHHVAVDTPKHEVLAAAKTTGDALGALFLMIGSFSIIAGALLLVNIFVMLAEERKGQLGMLRAIGMKRSRLVGALTLEGATYAAVSVLPAVALGIGVGYGVALLAARIFSTWSQDGNGLQIAFAVTPISVVNGLALGLTIAVVTILLTSVRISRFNIIGAIRDLPATTTARTRRWMLISGCAAAAVSAVLTVPALVTTSPVPTFMLPAMAAFFCVPLLRQRMDARRAATWTAGFVMVWALVAPVARPKIFDTPSMAVYVVSGTLVAFSGVVLVSQNQDVLLWPVRHFLQRPSQNGLAARLAIAYPLAKRFRTGATLVMYTLITLVLVLLAEISGMINKSVDQNVADATAGYGVRLDLNPAVAASTLSGLATGQSANQLAAITPLTSALAYTTDPGHRTTAPLRAVAVGVPAGSMTAMRFDRRLDSLKDDAAVWALLARDPSYVVLDPFFGATGGPNGHFYDPGDTFTVTNPVTGRTATRTIAGILRNGMVFYPTSGDGVNAFPFVASTASVVDLFGKSAAETSALVRLQPGVDPERLASLLQARYLSASLVATPVAANVRKMFAANIAFFRLMQGFLALGLLVGITGLGVVMVRAVRERRRTIGVLRALGFRASVVARSFLMESGIIAFEGIALGAVLGVLTTWLMYQKSAAFDGVRNGFPIVWMTIGVLAAATFVASLIATIGPARRASQIKPAIAVRIAD